MTGVFEPHRFGNERALCFGMFAARVQYLFVLLFRVGQYNQTIDADWGRRRHHRLLPRLRRTHLFPAWPRTATRAVHAAKVRAGAIPMRRPRSPMNGNRSTPAASALSIVTKGLLCAAPRRCTRRPLPVRSSWCSCGDAFPNASGLSRDSAVPAGSRDEQSRDGCVRGSVLGVTRSSVSRGNRGLAKSG